MDHKQLPRLQGTKRDVAFASRVRTAFLEHLQDVRLRSCDHGPLARAMRLLLDETSAAWWIAMRDANFQDLVINYVARQGSAFSIVTVPEIRDSSGAHVTVDCQCPDCKERPDLARTVTMDGREKAVRMASGFYDLLCARRQGVVSQQQAANYAKAHRATLFRFSVDDD